MHNLAGADVLLDQDGELEIVTEEEKIDRGFRWQRRTALELRLIGAALLVTVAVTAILLWRHMDATADEIVRRVGR